MSATGSDPTRPFGSGRLDVALAVGRRVEVKSGSSFEGTPPGTPERSCQGWEGAGGNCNRDLTEGFRAMLEAAVVKTGKMDVMERVQWDNIIAEQGLDELGLTDRRGRIGGLTGVDYYVYGTITRFGSADRSYRFEGVGLRKKQFAIEMGVDLKITEVATGRIVVADSVKATIEQGKQFRVAGYKKEGGSADPFADVQEVVAARIAETLVTSRIPIKVIQVQGDGTLILNYGDVFLAPGDRLAAYSVGESFVDPDTGEVLGSEETQVGVVEIVRAEQKFSRAKAVTGQIGTGVALRRFVGTEAVGAAPDQPGNERRRSGRDW